MFPCRPLLILLASSLAAATQLHQLADIKRGSGDSSIAPYYDK